MMQQNMMQTSSQPTPTSVLRSDGHLMPCEHDLLESPKIDDVADLDATLPDPSTPAPETLDRDSSTSTFSLRSATYRLADRPGNQYLASNLILLILLSGLLSTLIYGLSLLSAVRSVPAQTRLDLNQASASELETIPSIGPKSAENIVQFRRVHGPFPSVNALQRIPNIGPATVKQIAPHVLIDSPAPGSSGSSEPFSPVDGSNPP